MNREMWESLRSSMGQSPEQDASIRESVRQATANGATVPAGSQTLLPSAASWMPGQEQYPMFTDEASSFGYDAIDGAATDVLSQFAPSIADNTNKMTETKVTTKDADGNETTVIKKGKFDQEQATKKAYMEAQADATTPKTTTPDYMLSGEGVSGYDSNNMQAVPPSVFDDFRNSDAYRGIADTTQGEATKAAYMEAQADAMNPDMGYVDPALFNSQRNSDAYKGVTPVGTYQSPLTRGEATKAAYMEAQADAMNPDMGYVNPSVFDDFRNSDAYTTPPVSIPASDAANQPRIDVGDSTRTNDDRPLFGDYANGPSNNSFIDINKEGPIGTSYSGGPTQTNFDDSIVSDLPSSTEVATPGSTNVTNSDEVLSKKDGEEINGNPSAIAAVKELKARVDANPESKQEEYMAFLRETGHLKEWRPDLFKALTSAAVAIVTGGDPYQSVVDTLGYAGEEQEKLRLEGRTDEQANEKMIMDMISNNPGMSLKAFNATLKQLGVKNPGKFRALFNGAHEVAGKETAKDVAKARKDDKQYWFKINQSQLKAALSDKAYLVNPQLGAVYEAVDKMPGLSWGDAGVQVAIAGSLKQTVADFKANDEEDVDVNMLGHFWSKINIVGSSGTIAGTAIAETEAEDHARFVRWLYMQPDETKRITEVDRLQAEWEVDVQKHGSSFYGKKDFPKWAMRRINEEETARRLAISGQAG